MQVQTLAPALPTPGVKPDMAAAKRAGQDFEAVLIGQMLEPMWAGIKTDGAFGGGTGEEVFRSLMIQEVGRAIAKQGGIGIADSVTRELIRAQEGRP